MEVNLTKFYELNLQTIGRGNLARAFVSEVRLMQLAMEEAGRSEKGSIGISVRFERQEDGSVDVSYKIKSKLPEFEGSSIAEVADNGQLVLPLTMEEWTSCRLSPSEYSAMEVAKRFINDAEQSMDEGTSMTIETGGNKTTIEGKRKASDGN